MKKGATALARARPFRASSSAGAHLRPRKSRAQQHVGPTKHMPQHRKRQIVEYAAIYCACRARLDGHHRICEKRCRESFAHTCSHSTHWGCPNTMQRRYPMSTIHRHDTKRSDSSCHITHGYTPFFEGEDVKNGACGGASVGRLVGVARRFFALRDFGRHERLGQCIIGAPPLELNVPGRCFVCCTRTRLELVLNMTVLIAVLAS